MQHLTFVIKTSFDCNLNCVYCSEGQRRKDERLSISSIDAMFRNVRAYTRETPTTMTFLWHGGEPLLRGLDYYKYIVRKQKELGIDVCCDNQIQTNGVLLDKDFASFFTDNDISVGVSLDGPQAVHDAQRPKKNGKPSFDKVCKAISNIRDKGRDVGVVSVFTRNSLNNIEAYYDFFREYATNVRMNPLLEVGKAEKERMLQLTPREHGTALIHLYDRWINEQSVVFKFEPFYGIVRSIYTEQFNCCFLAGKCQNYFEVFPNGDLYLCGRQYSQQGKIGSLVHDKLSSLMNSPKRKTYALEKHSVREICGDCRHFNICHGGCTTSALAQQSNGKIRKDYFCESYKMLFDQVKETMSRALPPSAGRLITLGRT